MGTMVFTTALPQLRAKVWPVPTNTKILAVLLELLAMNWYSLKKHIVFSFNYLNHEDGEWSYQNTKMKNVLKV